MMRRVEGRPKYTIATVERSMSLLRVLTEAERPLSLGELVARLGSSKPSIYRLVRTLLDEGALREIRGEGYALGPVLISIGEAARRATRLSEVARPYMERLRESLDETVVLSMLDGDEIVYVDRIEVRQILSVSGAVGARLPAYCTSAGHALLSGLSDDEVRARLGSCAFERRTANTVVSLDKLLDRLAEVRDRGYAINDEELVLGHRSAATPVRDHGGNVAASMSISVPAARVSQGELVHFAIDHLIPAAEALTRDLGAPIAAADGDSVAESQGPSEAEAVPA